jgi:tyrosinase
MAGTLNVRRSIADLQKDYDSGNKAPLEKLMRAWKAIKELPVEHPDSFFTIGGFHGEPFRGKGAIDSAWWGGYCQHGTVLFPSWHRAYLWRLEKALQKVPGCADVMLPFWDECHEDSQKMGIPRALTDETFVLDGIEIPNPLRSFVLPVAIVDKVKDDPVVYSKPAGYETVRYPLSGLLGTAKDEAATKAHNAQFPDYERNVGYLNDNIATWLGGRIRIDGKWFGEVHNKFLGCLDAPNYTIFSNTTSAGAYNNAHRTKLVPLEAPHNYMHLAVGGFEYPGNGDFDAAPGANGDMGENDTAGLDPIFFFHHCFIDYVFWIWQRRHGATDGFTIAAGDPGTRFSSDFPPPAGMEPGDTLDMKTPLEPFSKSNGSGKTTTNDVVNIEKQLGYTYGPGSLDAFAQPPKAESMLATTVPIETGRRLHISRINRARIRGSFLISAFANVDGRREYIGTEAVLSRWHVEGCMNCMNHLEATATFRLPLIADQTPLPATGVEVEVRTRGGLLGGRAHTPKSATASPTALSAEAGEAPFLVEVT